MRKVWRRGVGGSRMEGAAGRGDEDESNSHGSHKKKHKKHKKKHKKRHHREDGVVAAVELGAALPKPQLKLKIKLGGQILGTKSVPTFTVIPERPRSPSPLMVVDDEDEPMEGVPIEQYRAWLGEMRIAIWSPPRCQSSTPTWPFPLVKKRRSSAGWTPWSGGSWMTTGSSRRRWTSPCSPPESPPAQAAEPAPAGAADGLQGQGADRGDAGEAGGAGSQAAPAGCQEGRGEQEPDHRAPHQDQQGQSEDAARAQSQGGRGPHGLLPQCC
ncbi:INO80 complex subunit B isoform X2 [Hemicordylus capensis]|uniref:INO80 complex subunit B isoform X2 n=1 Tax=Hemicordylus capensis TaxID=884348 RepID=UPI002302DF40|nr:INO80 complex subunit B isoform X2 [Hemicordylus capensis]